MSALQSQAFAHERVYRFISDPSHKENLSGRVRAACLTCRRKKIKCSGERDCRTCRERGLFCEGFSTGRRLRKDNNGFESVLAPVHAGIDRKNKLSALEGTSPKQSTTSNHTSQPKPQHSESASSSSGNASSIIKPCSRLSFNNGANAGPSTQPATSAPFQVDSWRLDDRVPIDTNPQDYIASAPANQTSFNLTQTQPEEDWWTDRIIDASGLSRRQTIASFLPLPAGGNQFESHYEITAPCISAFDDLALLLTTNRPPPGPSLSQSATHFSSWWDVSNMTPAFLEQAQGGGMAGVGASQPSGLDLDQHSTNAFHHQLWSNIPPE